MAVTAITHSLKVNASIVELERFQLPLNSRIGHRMMLGLVGDVLVQCLGIDGPYGFNAVIPSKGSRQSVAQQVLKTPLDRTNNARRSDGWLSAQEELNQLRCRQPMLKYAYPVRFRCLR